MYNAVVVHKVAHQKVKALLLNCTIVLFLAYLPTTEAISIFSVNVGRPVNTVIEELGDLILEYDPDFVFLQEVHLAAEDFNTKLKFKLRRKLPKYKYVLLLKTH